MMPAAFKPRDGAGGIEAAGEAAASDGKKNEFNYKYICKERERTAKVGRGLRVVE